MKQFFIPYITFNNCRETANYYKEIFDGEIIYVMQGKDTPKCKEEDLEKTMHLELKINKSMLYMSDGNHTKGDNISLLLNYEDLDQMMLHYNRMKEGNKVIKEMHDTYWGALYGVIKDKYDMTWEFHYTKTE